MKKPKKKVKEYYDYKECRDYLQKKYNYDERDYAGKFTGKGIKEKPYLDFWHWVIEHSSIHNGCFIIFSKETLEEITEDWVKEIYKKYIDEFADKNGELEMYVWW